MGVTITSTLSWSVHIHNISRKVRKLLGLLYRQFYGLVNPQQFMKLYSLIVRPHMEYASQVWNPHLKKNIDELENTQKMALRICARQWDLSYGDLLLNSKILTLAAQQEYLSLCTFYKIIHNQMFFPPNILHEGMLNLTFHSRMRMAPQCLRVNLYSWGHVSRSP